MPFPRPTSGLVIRYSYLWHAERRSGHLEGVKHRPCAIILVTQDADGEQLVTVLPVSHSAPADPALAIEIPPAVKVRLGLDRERSWIVLTEANRFVWPGPRLRPAVTGDPGTVAYGLLPRRLFEQVRAKFVAVLKANKAKVVFRQ